MRDLLKHLTTALESGRELIVCQVVETKGSTPQKAGALMIVDPGGGQVGTLGGGCVEAEVKQKAIRRLGKTGSEVHSFVLDHDYAWADGLICGGKMVITTEAFRGVEPLAYFHAYRRLLDDGQGFTEAVVVAPERFGSEIPAGSRFMFGPQGERSGRRHRANRPASRTPGTRGQERGRDASDVASGSPRDRGRGTRGAGGRRACRQGRF